ncbi:MAG: ATP-binding cassette domain-containing protein, partial [Planctomycetes bacterium]|nr:ATP-binding cassette domain-containing protein [Planctomycetota bacterium]
MRPRPPPLDGSALRLRLLAAKELRAKVEPVVDIRDLSVSFGARRVLHGLSLRASPGEITVVIGRSGSGKTTLLRAINRLNELFPSARTEGSIRLRLDGRWIDVNRDRVDTADLRRRAAMVFQSPNVLPVSIARNFAIPLRLALGLGAAAIRERMRKALADADLLEEVEDRLEESALHLSGGQQQRLCLARALALEPEILLVDEPTASLDFKATRRIEAL